MSLRNIGLLLGFIIFVALIVYLSMKYPGPTCVHSHTERRIKIVGMVGRVPITGMVSVAICDEWEKAKP